MCVCESIRTSLALALALVVLAGAVRSGLVGGGVTAGGDGVFVAAAVVVGGVVRMHVLPEIVHADALPHRIDHDSDTEQHDLAGGGGVAVA